MSTKKTVKKESSKDSSTISLKRELDKYVPMQYLTFVLKLEMFKTKHALEDVKKIPTFEAERTAGKLNLNVFNKSGHIKVKNVKFIEILCPARLSLKMTDVPKIKYVKKRKGGGFSITVPANEFVDYYCNIGVVTKPHTEKEDTTSLVHYVIKYIDDPRYIRILNKKKKKIAYVIPDFNTSMKEMKKGDK